MTHTRKGSFLAVLRNPWRLMLPLIYKGRFDGWSDRRFLQVAFLAHLGQRLNLRNPKTFNEKLQWLKLYNRKPLYTQLVDKWAVKKYIAEKIGERYVIPSLGVYDSFDEIDFDRLPDRFVLKCTNDSGGIVVCKDKGRLDKEKARHTLERSLKHSYFNLNREWPYKDVTPRILAEEYMEDSATGELRDYKFFCFDGVPKALFIASDRQKEGEEVKFDFFDAEFNHLPIRNGHPNSVELPTKPRGFEEMKRLAAKLSEGMPHVRVDFYEVDGRVYFGEMTFFHFSGMVPIIPKSYDLLFGSWLELPEN